MIFIPKPEVCVNTCVEIHTFAVPAVVWAFVCTAKKYSQEGVLPGGVFAKQPEKLRPCTGSMLLSCWWIRRMISAR